MVFNLDLHVKWSCFFQAAISFFGVDEAVTFSEIFILVH